MRKLAGVIALSLLLSACDKPKIDTSSDQSTKESIQKVRESLPDDKKSQFDEAVKVVALSQIDMRELMKAGASSGDVYEGKIKTALEGKTGEEVITYAETIRLEREKKEKEQAIQEIKELEAKQSASVEAADKLKAFKVERSRFYLEKQNYGPDQPVLDISVENGTDKSVARAFFKGVISSPGRSVPWYTDTFNYEIPGGLEPGEKAHWKLEPNMFSDWANVNAPDDAIFTVTVTELRDVDGKSIFGTTEFSEQDAERLKKLKEKYLSK
ncbi:DUF6694 family lipoprotein [Enterobacter hormaechei]|uniref:DUF6694 family lipoprotein n=1 Tax=Enterobacteriaceae TaxID=543 RepID=UPI003750EDB5